MSEQLSLFGGGVEPPGSRSRRVPAACPPTPGDADLARRLPPQVRLGTSSWSFPGWGGLVYDTSYDGTLLSRSGLAAYSAHPLLRTVSIDRAYYAPLPEAEYAGYARQVPPEFRFMVKAPAEITAAWLRGADGRSAGDNPRQFDAGFALDRFIRPAVDGLGDRCGPLVFQFPPQGYRAVRQARTFARRLGEFLAALPSGPLYAVELRDPELWTDEFLGVLRATGVRLCVSVHPRAPALDRQALALEALPAGPLVVRWNLNPLHRYEEAREHYAPFDRLVEEDPRSRNAIATLCRAAALAGQPAFVVANNKAEGCAPLTLGKLAAGIAAPA